MVPKEAQPIELKDLTKFERKVMQHICDRIGAIIQDNSSRRSANLGSEPFEAVVDETRSSRVVLIDGDRGTGKTSVLMTLIREWQTARRNPSVGAQTSGLELSLATLGPQVAILSVLDFDPLPEAIPLHGWLLQPWKRLVEWSDKSHPSDCTDDGESMSLRERWHDLFEVSTMGWTRAPIDGGFDRVLMHEKQADGWMQLPAQWKSFVSEAMHRLRYHQPRYELVLVPIDDVDLECERLPELLHAIRLLHHPHVVYLLTGDRKHLRHVLHTDWVRRHLVRAPDPRQARRWRWPEDDEPWPRILADALLEKALPDHACFSLKRLDLREVLCEKVRAVGAKDKHETIGTILNTAMGKTGRRGTGDYLSELSGDWNVALKDLITFRELQRLRERLSSVPELSRPHEILATLLRSYDYVCPETPTERGRYSRVGTLVATSPTMGLRSEVDRDWHVATGLNVEYRLRDEANATIGGASAAALAVALRDHRVIHAPGIKWEVGRVMVWTELTVGERDLIFLWPFATAQPELGELENCRVEWAAAIDTLEKDQRKETFDEKEMRHRLAASWINHLGMWTRRRRVRGNLFPEQSATSAEQRSQPGSLNIPELLNNLTESPEQAKLAREDKATVFEALFVLSAPAVGLPRETAAAIWSYADAYAQRNKLSTSNDLLWALWDKNLGEALYQGWLLLGPDDRKRKRKPSPDDVGVYHNEILQRTADRDVGAPEWRVRVPPVSTTTTGRRKESVGPKGS